MSLHLTLGKRIGLGFVLVLSLTVAVGGAGYLALNRLLAMADLYREVNRIQREVAAAGASRALYLLSNYDEAREEQAAAGKRFTAQVEACKEGIAALEGDEDQSQEIRKALSEARERVAGWRKGFDRYDAGEREKMALALDMMARSQAFVTVINKDPFQIENMVSAHGVLDAGREGYIQRNSRTRWEKIEAYATGLEKAIEDWKEIVGRSSSLGPIAKEAREIFEGYRGQLFAYHEHVLTQEKELKEMERTEAGLAKIFQEIDTLMIEAFTSVERLSTRIILGCLLSALLLGILYAVLSTRSLVRKIRGVIEGVIEGTSQVVGTAGVTASESQTLAEGASEQAAAIEESSSSLEEISSMTRQNAANADQADTLMKEANRVVSEANASMGDLTGSMGEISRSSEETFRIIRTIDEIAFQTNLLALNAAVEAARAGSAGAGFAVVADEVRNLALRVTEAAKTTSGLIEGTVERVKTGASLVERTRETFARVRADSAKVGDLIGDIAAASREQAQGIEQVNKAVSEMDKIVQANAAAAEASASAAEEMLNQAARMRGVVDELVEIVGLEMERGEAASPGGNPGDPVPPRALPVSREGGDLAVVKVRGRF